MKKASQIFQWGLAVACKMSKEQWLFISNSNIASLVHPGFFLVETGLLT